MVRMTLMDILKFLTNNHFLDNTDNNKQSK